MFCPVYALVCHFWRKIVAIGCSKGSAPLPMDTWPSWIRRWPPKPQIAGSNPAVSAILNSCRPENSENVIDQSEQYSDQSYVQFSLEEKEM